MDSNKPWDGRFSKQTHQKVELFNASIGFDWVLAPYDIAGSIAHAKMLGKSQIINNDEVLQIVAGLEQILDDIKDSKVNWRIDLEDIHMNIEALLVEKIGDVGKKLHTARSRNDQVATDLRLYLRDQNQQVIQMLKQLIQTLCSIAYQHIQTIMPGFTHLQCAQPVSLAHHLHAYAQMFLRDKGRFEKIHTTINQLPLGSGALAGTTFSIDRLFVARELDFDGVCENSLDAVSDRDFVIEWMAHASICMMHLSRLCEEMILWSSAQFGFIEISDAFCTGSSMMPQKKNPDMPELVRGKSARVFGHLMQMLSLMKSQPLAYNKDNQEDKESLFDSVKTLYGSLEIFNLMLPQTHFCTDTMYQAAQKGYATATDLAEYLVAKGVAFRDAHHIVGQCVALAIEHECDLNELSIQQLQKLCPKIEPDIFEFLLPEAALNRRISFGGCAPSTVKSAIDKTLAAL